MYCPVPDTSLHTPLIDSVPSLNELTFEQVVESYSNNLLDEDDMDQIHTVDYSLPYKRNWAMTAVFIVLCVASLGILPLFCHWYPEIMLLLTHLRSDVHSCTAVLSKSSLTKQKTISYVKTCRIIIGDVVQTFRLYHYRYMCYIYNERLSKFVRVRFNTSIPFNQIYNNMLSGVSMEQRVIRRILFGNNNIDVQIKNPIALLLDEILHPFYIFQVFSIIVWILTEYYLYAAVIFISSAISALISLIETQRNLFNLRDMSKYSCGVTRYYMNNPERVNSESLVPGDIIEIVDGMKLPCDILLVTGECILNESMLTGESIPVVKSQFPKESEEIYSPLKHKNNTLFAGTIVLQTKKRSEERVLGICIRTGFDTAKGNLVLSILYPRPSHFKYYQDAFKFVGVLFLVSFVGFVYVAIRKIIMKIPAYEIILHGLDLITIAVPPALPVAITVGTALAISRLKRKYIYTINPSKVNVAGKINCMCFDKTGTLTEDGLDLKGIKVVNNSKFDAIESYNILSFMEQSVQFLKEDFNCLFIFAMASCHSLALANGIFIGDPLEFTIFKSVRWELHEPEDRHGNILALVRPPLSSSQKGLISPIETSVELEESSLEPLSTNPSIQTFIGLGIIKRFDFSSELKRMSVVVKNLSTGSTFVIVKGSPEHIRPLCITSSIPNDFDQYLFDDTYKGFRVLAYAYKKIADNNQAIDRGNAESDLIFLGFITLQNKIKNDTPSIIHQLSAASIENIMVTGDNSLTAVHVAHQCGIIKPDTKVYVGDIINNEIVWKDVESDLRLDRETLKPISEDSRPYDLAITGAAFQKLYNLYSRPDVLIHKEEDPNPYHKLLCLCKVYSRMSPDQKRILSEELQKLDYFVGFCGDGANDTGSLKASHIGISLSQAEASIAAPFTSLLPTISCVSTVIKEGRASLLTSFQIFKYMAFYSLIQFFCIILLSDINSTLGNYQFLFVDLLVILPIVFLMSRTGTAEKLGNERPSGSLLNPLVCLSLFFQIGFACCIMILTLVRLRTQSWYIPIKPKPIAIQNVVCSDVTSLFLISTALTYSITFAYTISRPFKKALFTNIPLCIVLIILAALQIYVLFFPGRYTRYWLQLEQIPLKWKLELLGYALAHLIISYIFEELIIVGPGKRIAKNILKGRIRTLVQNTHNSREGKYMNKLRLSKKKYNQIRYKIRQNIRV
jgi:cation-transporting ATPase 13A2